MNQMPNANSNPARKERIIADLRKVIHELSGQDQSGTDATATFFDLGFDSLFLTQASQAFRNKFGVKLSFRQLLEDFVSIDAVADYLDQSMPADKAPSPPPPTPAPAVVHSEPLPVVANLRAKASSKSEPAKASSQPVPGTLLERIMKEQLRVMAEQLELLRGGSAGASSPLAATSSTAPAKLDVATDAESAVQSGSVAVPSEPVKADPKVFGPYRPIQKSASSGFTERQQTFLDALIARYTQRTKKSKELTQRHRKHFSDPRTVSGFRLQWKEMVYPIVTERSSGARVWDIDGNEYIDFVMGFGTNLLGHSPPFITAAIEEQLKKGIEVGPQTPLAGPVAELMCELTGMERCAFCNTGSEAVLATIRVARTVTGRNKIVYFVGDYHGIFDEVLQRPTTVNGERRVLPIAPGIPPQHDGSVMILDYDRADSLEIIKAQGHEIAAVIVEPVQSRHPDLQPREFLRELRRITRECGSALVFDEVITGFRSHPGGVQALFDIRADLASYGKLIGGGLQIGAVCGSAAFMDALDGGHWSYGDSSIPEVGVTFFAGTYVRHPLTMAASYAILNHLKSEGPQLQRKLNERWTATVSELNQFLRERQVPIFIEHFSSAFWVRFDSQIKHPGLLFFLLRERGIHISEGRLFFLSTAHTEADVRTLIEAFKSSILDMQLGGFLPETPGEISAPTPAPVTIVRSEPPSLPPPLREVTPVQPLLATSVPRLTATPSREIKFSLYFFGNYPSTYAENKYDLLIEAARFADQNGFTGIWIPERHFHPVGGFSPNPSVVAAALARETKRLQLRGGSVVLPLHNPIRVAEEWSLVDNLSNGRVGIAIASGWHPNDFVFAPDAYEKRRELCSEGLALIRKLWRGQAIPVRGGANNPLDVTLYPLPRQRELPTWLTCVQKSSYITAGEMGIGVLAMATNQTLDEIAGKIAAYRESFVRHGHPPERAHVTLLLHTYVGENLERTLAQARGPMCDYLRSYLDNSQKRHESKGGPLEVSPEDMDYLLNRSFDDYVKGKALIGTPESCARVVEKFREIGVDEIGCFIDFGVAPEKVLESLPHLHALKQRFEDAPAASEEAQRDDASVCVSSDETRQIPLTESQQGLWAMMLMTPAANRAYNEVTTLRLCGPVDLDALERALQTLMNRHEALRTTIDRNGEFQTVHRQAALALERVNLSGVSENERATRLRTEFEKTEHFAFDFQSGPAMRALVIRLAEDHHLLLLTFHHLFGNGPSFVAAFGELCPVYAALTAGQPIELAPALQLSGYERWLREQADSGATHADEAFWGSHLAGIPAGLDLPADRPRPPLITYRGGRCSLKIERELTARIRKAGASLRSSMFMTLFAAHNVWLHRLAGQNDLVVGVPFEGPARSLPGGGSLFANTTNMMPLRSRVGEQTTFAELVTATKAVVLEANEHQNFFFARLIEKLNLRHDLSRPPIFSVSFNYESGKFQKQIGALNVELVLEDVPFGSPPDTAKFDLCINVAEKDGELQFDCDFNADLFDDATIRRWLGHQKMLLAGIVADPRQSIWSLPLLNEAEQKQILTEWNATAHANPPADFLDQMFLAQVKRSPDAVAVEYEGRRLTFSELNTRANRLAQHLRKHGAGADALVGICIDRSLEMVVGLLGILKAGAAYVPLDPDYPTERLAFMLADAQAPVLVTQAGFLDELPPTAARVICLDRDWETIAQEPDECPVVTRTGESLAYVIYTSGSTGQPKGVMIPHRAICNHMRWMQRIFSPGKEDAVLQKTPFSFDASVWEFYEPLLTGGRLVMARPGGHLDAAYQAEIVQVARVTSLQLVPSQLTMLLDEPKFAHCRTLRRLFCGGEALSLELIKRFRTVLPWASLHNMYGPTEAAIDSTAWDCPLQQDPAVVVIGRPIDNVRAYILDRLLQPVPIGVPGELHIGGRGLGRGYFNRPQLTAEKFIADPFAEQPGARMYRTGDLCRYLPDGNIEYLGRLDFQVKVRGFRIELGEIETVLEEHPAIKQATVLVREDIPGDKRIVAYVAPKADNTLALEELRRLVSQRLPAYMVPNAFVAMEQLPLNPSGKVDRKALPQPEIVTDGNENQYVAPRSPVEEKLCGIWSEVLRAKKVGINDNFLDLGGHSLLAMQVISRVSRALSVQLPMRTLFENPTVSGLALAITRLQLDQASPDQVEQLLRELEADAPAAGATTKL